MSPVWGMLSISATFRRAVFPVTPWKSFTHSEDEMLVQGILLWLA